MKKSKKGVVHIELYVGNNLLIRSLEEIDETVELLQKNGLVVKVKDDLHDHFLCETKFSKIKREHG